MTKLPLVAFDLDDTLYPEREYALSALHAAGEYIAKNFGLEGIGRDATSLFESDNAPPLPLNAALELRGISLSDEQLQQVRAHMNAHLPAIQPFPDALEVLDSLRGVARVAILTEGRVNTQTAKIEALHLGAHVDDVLITESLVPPAGKASGVPFRALRERFDSDRFVYIGDNPAKDVMPAQQHGFLTIVVRRDDCRYVHPIDKGTEVVRDLREALPLIFKMIDGQQPRR